MLEAKPHPLKDPGTPAEEVKEDEGEGVERASLVEETEVDDSELVVDASGCVSWGRQQVVDEVVCQEEEANSESRLQCPRWPCKRV